MSIILKVLNRRKWNVLVEVRGRLDGETAGQFEAFANELIQDEALSTSFTFDMDGLDYVSSMGLRVILMARKKIEKNDGKMLMANLQAPVKHVIDIANVLPSWGLFQNVQEADAYFDAMQQKAKDGANE